MQQQAKVAIVTGAGQGIGLSVAQRLVREGWRVMIADLDGEAGREAVEALAGEDGGERQGADGHARADGTDRRPGEARFFEVDVSRGDDVRWLVRHTLAAWGRIDGLVNNAGTMIRRPLAALTAAEWHRVLDVNLTAPFLCTREAAAALQASHGAVVNIASMRAYMSEPDTEAYAASKGGLVALTHALAMSLGPRVRVNSVSPGWIEVSDWKKAALREPPALTDTDHEQHPVGRVGRPADVAAAVSWLLSGEAGFVTGADLIVDGGMTRKMIYL